MFHAGDGNGGIGGDLSRNGALVTLVLFPVDSIRGMASSSHSSTARSDGSSMLSQSDVANLTRSCKESLRVSGAILSRVIV